MFIDMFEWTQTAVQFNYLWKWDICQETNLAVLVALTVGIRNDIDGKKETGGRPRREC